MLIITILLFLPNISHLITQPNHETQPTKRKQHKKQHTSFPQQPNIGPIEPGPGARENPHGVRQQRDELGVPVPHLAAGAPERAVDGVEVAPAAVPQRRRELGPLALRRLRPHDVEPRREVRERLRVVPDWVADVQDFGLAAGYGGGVEGG